MSEIDVLKHMEIYRKTLKWFNIWSMEKCMKRTGICLPSVGILFILWNDKVDYHYFYPTQVNYMSIVNALSKQSPDRYNEVDTYEF